MAEYIEREALKQKIVDEQTENHMSNHPAAYKVGYHNGLTMAIAMVINTPAADVAPAVHGVWKSKIDYDPLWGDIDFDKCSVCGVCQYVPSPYCPNCGARMDGDG